MGRTIIQPIGPLYGEAVNGTVFGRPNGSVYVPPTNTITLSLGGFTKICNGAGTFAKWIYPSNDSGVPQTPKVEIVAQSQDNAACMAIQLSDDSDFTTYEENRLQAGQFNKLISAVMPVSNYELADSDTYYVRAVLYAASGVAVAYSETITVTAVVP